jgi:hypothetical protein
MADVFLASVFHPQSVCFFFVPLLPNLSHLYFEQRFVPVTLWVLRAAPLGDLSVWAVFQTHREVSLGFHSENPIRDLRAAFTVMRPRDDPVIGVARNKSSG